MNSLLDYSADMNSKLVRYLNGPKQFVPSMVHYSSHILNSEPIVPYSNGNNLATKWHLVTELFTVDPNQMLRTIQLVTI